MFQVVQNRSVCLELGVYVKNIGPETHTSLGDQQVPGLREPKVGLGQDCGSQCQGQETTVEQWR